MNKFIVPGINEANDITEEFHDLVRYCLDVILENMFQKTFTIRPLPKAREKISADQELASLEYYQHSRE